MAMVDIAGYAQTSGTPIYRELSLISGWNLYLTNGTTIGPGYINEPFTTFNGVIGNSLTNYASNTNVTWGDAFNTDGVALPTDTTGNFVANCAIHVLLDNTNLIPVAVTNSFGQFFVTNSWPLSPSQAPNWMYPATTNIYIGAVAGASTNRITLYFQRGWRYPLGLSKSYTVWDSVTNGFQFSVDGSTAYQSGTGGAGFVYAFSTNLPTSFTQGANRIRVAAIVCGTATGATGTAGGPQILNALSVGAPTP